MSKKPAEDRRLDNDEDSSSSESTTDDEDSSDSDDEDTTSDEELVEEEWPDDGGIRMKLDAIELTGDVPVRTTGISAIEDLRVDLLEFMIVPPRDKGEGHGHLRRKPPITKYSKLYFDLSNSLTAVCKGMDWKTLVNMSQKRIKKEKKLYDLLHPPPPPPPPEPPGLTIIKMKPVTFHMKSWEGTQIINLMDFKNGWL